MKTKTRGKKNFFFLFLICMNRLYMCDHLWSDHIIPLTTTTTTITPFTSMKQSHYKWFWWWLWWLSQINVDLHHDDDDDVYDDNDCEFFFSFLFFNIFYSKKKKKKKIYIITLGMIVHQSFIMQIKMIFCFVLFRQTLQCVLFLSNGWWWWWLW